MENINHCAVSHLLPLCQVLNTKVGILGHGKEVGPPWVLSILETMVADDCTIVDFFHFSGTADFQGLTICNRKITHVNNFIYCV